MGVINNHKDAVKTVHVGNFEVLVQLQCEIEVPEKPTPETPVTEECAAARYDAKVLAKKIATLQAGNPALPSKVEMGLVTCEFKIERKKTFEIYNECWNGEFMEEYKKYFDELKQQLEAEGWKFDGEKFEYVVEGETVKLENEAKLELVSTN